MKHKFRIVAAIEIIINATSSAKADKIFEDLDLGHLEDAKDAGVIANWDYRDAEPMQIENKESHTWKDL